MEKQREAWQYARRTVMLVRLRNILPDCDKHQLG